MTRSEVCVELSVRGATVLSLGQMPGQCVYMTAALEGCVRFPKAVTSS